MEKFIIYFIKAYLFYTHEISYDTSILVLVSRVVKLSKIIATWNINSVRLRAALVAKLLKEEAPDVLCLQECKSPVDKIPIDLFVDCGYPYMVARGQKGYNGVMILSRRPIEEVGAYDFGKLGDARHIAGRLENGLVIHNFYVPAGGNIPDRKINDKFGNKLDYLLAMKAFFQETIPRKSILVGDLNIAPREDDVWDHKKLINVVSHTPIEVEALAEVQTSGSWVDVTRQHFPDGKLYSWWSYRAANWAATNKGRRLDHIWASRDVYDKAYSSRILSHVRGWDRPSDHVPVFATFDL